jgi:hypothetical protein
VAIGEIRRPVFAFKGWVLADGLEQPDPLVGRAATDPEDLLAVVAEGAQDRMGEAIAFLEPRERRALGEPDLGRDGA